MPVRRPTPDRDTLDLAELDARLVLRRGALDVHGVHVASTQGTVRVSGTLASASERRTLEHQLARLPHIQVALRVSRIKALPAFRRAAPSKAATAVSSDAPLDVSTPNSPIFDTEIQRSIVTIRQHLIAIRNLARRFSPTDVRALSLLARHKLQHLLDLYYRALHAELDVLDARLAMRFRLQGRRTLMSPKAPTDWRQRASEALTYTETLDRLVGPPFGTKRQLNVDEIGAAFGALWQVLNGAP